MAGEALPFLFSPPQPNLLIPPLEPELPFTFTTTSNRAIQHPGTLQFCGWFPISFGLGRGLLPQKNNLRSRVPHSQALTLRQDLHSGRRKTFIAPATSLGRAGKAGVGMGLQPRSALAMPWDTGSQGVMVRVLSRQS